MADQIAVINTAATNAAAIAAAVFALVVGIKTFKWARTAL